MPRLACVTMTYNEVLLLPVWLRHYGGQVGLENCFVIDHGSNDGSTDDLGDAKVIRLARSALDEEQRAASMSGFCNKLLQHYDYVLFTDTDEFAVPDPERADGLLDFLSAAGPVTTCIGMDIVHSLQTEGRLNLDRPILEQRAYASPRRSMCKPSLFRREMRFTPGFHTYDGDFKFDRLFLFHLAWADLDHALTRQAKRRTQIYNDDTTDLHHRVSDKTVIGWMQNWATLRATYEDTTFRMDDPQMRSFLLDLMNSAKARVHPTYGFDMNDDPNSRWRIPERFRGCL